MSMEAFGNQLAEQRRRETSLAKLHHGAAHFFVLCDQCADANTAFRVTFGHGVDENHVLLDAFEVACGDVGGARVDEFAVNFVGEQI